MEIIDAHIHCGDKKNTKYFPIEQVEEALKEANATGAVIFAFPEDIYRIVDEPDWRRAANEYVLEVAKSRPNIFPFYFIWNDFYLPENLDEYLGVKWHRHADEPRYDYDALGCRKALERIKELQLPVVLEEEFDNTARLINENPDINFIIPHMGMLNGGFHRMKVFFGKGNVYFDTAVASLAHIAEALDAVGAERIIFGSDVSGTSEPFFNFPRNELAKLRQLKLSDSDAKLILAENIKRLMARK